MTQRSVPELIRTAKALKSKAEHAADKAEQFYISLGLTLKELKERKPNDITWPVFVQKHFGYRQERADELIRIGDGRTTVEVVRSKVKQAVQKHRVANSGLRNPELSKKRDDTPWTEELRTELYPIISKLKKEGLKNMATMSPAAVAYEAGKLQNLLNRWVDPKLSKSAQIDPAADSEAELIATRKEIERLRAELEKTKTASPSKVNGELQIAKRPDNLRLAWCGVMNRATFNLILSCLHADSRKSATEKKLNDVFNTFKKLIEPFVMTKEEEAEQEKSYARARAFDASIRRGMAERRRKVQEQAARKAAKRAAAKTARKTTSSPTASL